MFQTLSEALDYLYNQRNSHKDLERLRRCIKKLGINLNYKKILIAGTNGKGSTALFIKNILKNSSKVGCFTSPFVIRFNERIMINDRQISDAEIMYYMNELFNLQDWYKTNFNEIIPFFELTLLMALLYFQDRDINIAIFECGIGGLNDSCNVFDADVSIITSIGYDHLDVLGNTLEEILKNKLGIVRQNQNFIYCNNNNDLEIIYNDYIKKYNLNATNVFNLVSDIKSDKYTEFKYNNKLYRTKLLGDFQAYNATIAIEAVKRLFINYPEIYIEEGINTSYIPARLEIINNNPLTILDGAHNIDAIKSSIDYLSKLKDNKKFITVFSCLNNKDYKNMIKELDSITDIYLFFDLNDERKTDINLFIESTKKESHIIYNVDEINKYLKDNSIILYTGSLHFASYIKNLKNN